MARVAFRTDLPERLAVLAELALDLRWTWSHAGDDLWRMVSPEVWERTRNPWALLHPAFREELRKLTGLRQRYLSEPSWYAQNYPAAELKRIAYFSLEFGLGESLPLYAGGLGILAGDYLKTASDLGVPAVGVGLLYQVGYFRQIVDAGGWQHEMYPYNEPASLPIQPVEAPAADGCMSHSILPDGRSSCACGARRWGAWRCICWIATTR
jgi:glycogen phosphorylase